MQLAGASIVVCLLVPQPGRITQSQILSPVVKAVASLAVVELATVELIPALEPVLELVPKQELAIDILEQALLHLAWSTVVRLAHVVALGPVVLLGDVHLVQDVQQNQQLQQKAGTMVNTTMYSMTQTLINT